MADCGLEFAADVEDDGAWIPVGITEYGDRVVPAVLGRALMGVSFSGAWILTLFSGRAVWGRS